MSKTMTILLLSGSAENEDAEFATRLAQAAQEKGHKIQMYLFGNAVNISKKEIPIEGDDLHIQKRLLDHIRPTKCFERVAEIITKEATFPHVTLMNTPEASNPANTWTVSNGVT